MRKQLFKIGSFAILFFLLEIVFSYLFTGYFSPSVERKTLISTILLLSITTNLLFTPPTKNISYLFNPTVTLDYSFVYQSMDRGIYFADRYTTNDWICYWNLLSNSLTWHIDFR